MRASIEVNRWNDRFRAGHDQRHARGRLGSCSCGGPSRRGGRPMANGAGIAADPTLTGVWMTFRLWCLRRTFGVLLRAAMLDARCLASRCPALRPACQRFVTGARAGIRLSLVAGCASPCGLSPLVSAALHIRSAEAASLYRCSVLRLGGFRRFPLLFLPARFLACPVTSRRALSLMGWLAFGRSLLHAVPNRARGQMPPPSLGSKLQVLQSLAAFSSRRLVSRRQLQSAPERAF